MGVRVRAHRVGAGASADRNANPQQRANTASPTAI
jgi:hypothetical protein